MQYSWSFELSFMVFLGVVFVSQALAGSVKSIIPMPLVFGVIFFAGYATGIFPPDIIQSSNMIAVGTIAFNVLVVHIGTTIDFKMIQKFNKPAIICVASTLVVVAVVGFALAPVVGRDIALLAPGSILGGGASCAIASRWVLDKNPAISIFPWLVFMFQGAFSVPIVALAVKKEATYLAAEAKNAYIPATDKPVTNPKLVDKLPAFAKTPAYYLLSIMVITVLNSLLHRVVLIPLGISININVTALLLGILASQLGVIERAPLDKSDSYGLLLLGLMGLMAETVAHTPLPLALSLLVPMLITFAVSTLLLVGCGAGMAKWFGLRPAQGIMLAMNSMMGFPVNGMLINNAVKGMAQRESAYVRANIAPMLGMGTMLISNSLSIFIVSIMVSMV